MKSKGVKLKQKKKLQQSFILVLVVMLVVMQVALGVAVDLYYQNTVDDYFYDRAAIQSQIIAKAIDGDTIEGYLQNKEKDDYYNSVNNYITFIRKTAKLEYAYVLVPRDNDLVYIWDAGVDNGKNRFSLGDLVYYDNDTEKQRIMQAMSDTSGQVYWLTESNPDYGETITGFKAIENSAGQSVALACVDLSLEQLKMAIIRFVVLVDGIILGITAFCTASIYFRLHRRVIHPIHQLNDAVTGFKLEQIQDAQPFCVELGTEDELQDLADAFGDMSIELKLYLYNLTKVTAENERISADLELAAQIQKSLLPREFPAYPERQEFRLYATMDPAREVGGDFYDFFLIDDDHLAVVIADVSGKGVPAALFMVRAKTLIKGQALGCWDLSTIFTEANDQLCENNEEGMFVTAWMGIVTLSDGSLVTINAGHNPPMIARAGGDFEFLKCRPGFILAGMEGMIYRQESWHLNPGDKLFLYTDGVTEAVDDNLELYGEDRLQAAVKGHGGDDPQDLLATVKADVDRFVGEAEQADDITMLALAYDGPATAEEGPAGTGGGLARPEGDEVVRRKDVFPATKAGMNAMMAAVHAGLEDGGWPPAKIDQLDIALEELYVNIVRYAYAATIGSVRAAWAITRDPASITITLVDTGVPFDPVAWKDPKRLSDSESAAIGGWGIFMAKQSLDALRYKREGGENRVTLVLSRDGKKEDSWETE